MNKLAIVVQRCHQDIIGGSEAEAWHYGVLLKKKYKIDILTTTAIDYDKWDNLLPEGDEVRDGICIKRFKVSQGRISYWRKILGQLLGEFKNMKYESSKKITGKLIEWPVALQEEFIYKQGPYSDDLINFLSERSKDYEAVIFLTYLYPTTYFGMFVVPESKIIFIPTLHNEAPAYLSVYKYLAKRAKIILWNTDSESRFGRVLWGDLPGCVLGMGVETRQFAPAELNFPYILYCGRIDAGKGSPQMVRYFLKFKDDCHTELRLILTGDKRINLPAKEYIIYKGIVSEEEKFKLLSGADIFIMPSSHESFNIATLEAMAKKTPVLASSGSEVIVDHIKKSGGGLLYNNYASFKCGVNFILENKDKANEMGRKGRNYVVENYSTKKISKKINDVIETII